MLLNTFLSEDCNDHARQKLLGAINELKNFRAPVVREFTFNRFNVTIDSRTKEVTLRDDLTVGPEGECRLRMEEFERALGQRA